MGEFGFDEGRIPFLPRRYFAVYDVPGGRVRGEHAHKECEQFLLCLSGSLSVVADNGRQREPSIGEPRNGIVSRPNDVHYVVRLLAGRRVVVFASHAYDPNDYIRDYDQFVASATSA